MSAEAAQPAAAAAAGPRDIGPDGEKIKDMSLYDLLDVPGNASEADIKKAYRKLAVKWHPDRHSATPETQEEAAAKFVEIGEAYKILSDPQARAAYNRDGKTKPGDMAEGMGFDDASKMFSNLFGGGKFDAWIGKISLFEDFTKAVDISMTPEEKAAMEAEMRKETSQPAPPPPSSVTAQPHVEPTANSGPPSSTAAEPVPSDKPAATAAAATPAAASSGDTPAPTAAGTPGATSPSGGNTPSAAPDAAHEPPKKPGKMTPEQRQQLYEYEKQKAAAKIERVNTLTKNLKARIGPFVDAQMKGAQGLKAEEDEGTQRFEKSLKQEIEDLKLESFGIELCHLIGAIYVTKSVSFLRLHKKPTSNVLGLPGWWAKMKEKGTTIKEGWSFVSSTMDLQSAAADLQKRQEAIGDEGVEDAIMKELEEDLSGKILLTTWRGARFEVSNILRQVVDNVLAREPGITDVDRNARAQAIFLIGSMFKAVQADESDEERRELERLVASAAAKSKEKKKRGGKSSTKPVSP